MKILPKHSVAALRQALKLTQQQMAALTGVKTPTIQAIELGKLTLSPGLATRINTETGANIGWLLKGEPTPPVDEEGEEITEVAFAAHQAVAKFFDHDPDAEFYSVCGFLSAAVLNLVEIHFLNKAAQRSSHLLQFRISEQIRELYGEFGRKQFPTGWASIQNVKDSKWRDENRKAELSKFLTDLLFSEFKDRGWISQKRKNPKEVAYNAGRAFEREKVKAFEEFKASVIKAQSKTTPSPRRRSKGSGNSGKA